MSAAACSDGAFAVAGGTEDASADEGTSADVSLETGGTVDVDASMPGEDASAETAKTDDGLTTAETSAETSVTLDAADGGQTEPSDGAAPDAATTETCVPNGCGGCTALAQPLNSGPCGKCGGGTWQCDGQNAVKCVSANATNSCGGCATLPHPKDEACGKCGSGKYICAISGEATSCSDPVPAASPAVGTACGTCGTKQMICNDSNTDTKCSGDDANACGGCGTLAGVPNTACGGCGKWTCATGNASVTCVEATPTVNSACGTCMTSKNLCTALATTTCQTPDDRTNGTELTTSGGTKSTIYTAARTPNLYAGWLATTFGATFKVGHPGTITTVSVALARSAYQCGQVVCGTTSGDGVCACEASNASGYCACAVPGAQIAAGKVYLSLYAGALPAPGAVPLATAEIAGNAAAFGDGSGQLIPFTFASTKTFAAGDVVSIVVKSDSSAYAFHSMTSPRSTANLERLLRFLRSDGVWVGNGDGSEEFPTMSVEMRACFGP